MKGIGITVSLALALLMGGQELGATPREPSARELRSLVEGHAHAIETNNRELALSYVHPRSPWRAEIDLALRDQLESYMERARTSGLEPMHLPDGTISAEVDQQFVRVFGLKLTRGTRRSIYRFRELGGSWRISKIDEVRAQ